MVNAAGLAVDGALFVVVDFVAKMDERGFEPDWNVSCYSGEEEEGEVNP